MAHSVKAPKKLIEVALPLDAINEACAYEKMPGIGAHPRGIHLWWARRPLAAARAVIFSQMVNDPSWKWEMERPGEIPPGHLKASWAASRKRLFEIIENLVLWKNTTNEAVLERARVEIRKSWRETCELNRDHPRAAELFAPDKLPAFHDPFAGGGALPLEAQRLGLEAYASDLNPVAVLINKAMIEIPPKFAGRPPVSLSKKREGIGKGWPDLDFSAAGLDVSGSKESSWVGAKGLAEDVRYYGQWMRDEAEKRIGHLYPPLKVTAEMALERPDLQPYVGRKLTVIAWLWARTVKSPNPAYSHIDVPLISTFMLSTKPGKEAYVEPLVEGDSYRFTVKVGKHADPAVATNGTKLGRGANFCCLLSDTPISGGYIKAEGKAGRMGARLMAIVAEGDRGRIYLPPMPEHEIIARQAKPMWRPTGDVPARLTGGTCVPYGLKEWGDLFTPRQLVAMTTLSDLVAEVRDKIQLDAVASGMSEDGCGLAVGGGGAKAYAEAMGVYLAFILDRCADFSNSCTRWVPGNQKVMNLFSKQAIAMTWDFPEAAILHNTVGGFVPAAEFIAECILKFAKNGSGIAVQQDAMTSRIASRKVISTDPPYYDNIGYADLSDFFYVWLRRSLKPIFPDLFATLTVPKAEELVATPYRHGSKEKAEEFFLDGMTQAMQQLVEQANPSFPVTIYYAFKQSETDSSSGTSSSGWETFLEAVLRAGFTITGTWPLRSEQEYRMIGMGTNALASSIVLVCCWRPVDAPTVSRREFLRELNQVLPEALDEMTRGTGDDSSPVAPVDLSQAVIGPGMAVFSKYAAVLEADGTPMSMRTALQLINRFLAEDDFDRDTQFCLHWFEQCSWGEGAFGEADVLARAKGTSVSGLVEAGVVESGGGKVRLRKWAEYPDDWDPLTDKRLPVWEALHHLIRLVRGKEGESGAARALGGMLDKAESVRQLAYRLYTLCERRGWAEEARAYNELITSWTGIESTAISETQPRQGRLFD